MKILQGILLLVVIVATGIVGYKIVMEQPLNLIEKIITSSIFAFYLFNEIDDFTEK